MKSGLIAALVCFAVLLPVMPAAASLTLNDEYASVKIVAYDIPEGDGRAEAVKYVESIRDRFYKGLDVVDITKLDDAALKDKLKDEFVLYTVLSDQSKLLKAALLPLGMRIDGSALHWGDLNVAVGDLRVITLAKNPYSDGRCIIYAAGTNQLLAKANDVFHGPCSYHVFQGDKLLREGYLNEQWQDASHLNKDQAVEDVHQYFSTLQRVHPDLLAKVNIEDYIKLKQSTVDGIEAKLGKDGKINVADLAYLLYYAAAYFEDGHTSVNWRCSPSQMNSPARLFPPFALRCDNGSFVIAGAVDKTLDGMEVVSVGGKPVREFLAPILDRCSGETLAFKAVRFINTQSFWYSFTNLLNSASSIELGLRDAKGKQSTRRVDTIRLEEFQKIESAEHQKRMASSQGTRVSYPDSGKVALFTYPGFNMSDDEKKKIDGIFTEIKDKKCQDLIIDIRGNGGGNSMMGDFIFSYLYDKPFRTFSKMRIKLSRDVLSSVAKGSDFPESADLDGLTADEIDAERSVPKPKAFFSGHTYLLVDNGSFSAASGFAALFRDYEVGKIVGYETGGLPCCFGDVYSFNLKNSGISCGCSWKQFFGPKPRPGDDEHGIIPDVPMTSDLLQSYQGEDDPVMAFTLDRIRKSRGK